MIQALKEAVLGKGHADGALREDVYQKVAHQILSGDTNPITPTTLNTYIEKLSKQAYKIVDRDIDQLKGEGFSEDEIFELTIVGATAAGITRLEKGLQALQKCQ